MIEFNWQLMLRFAVLAVVGVLLETSVISRFELLGSNADIMPIVVAAVGLTCGAIAGTGFGFGMGLFADSAMGMTIGVASLVFLTIGYMAGRARDIRDPQGAYVAPAAGAIATVASLAGFGLVSFVLGIDAPVSPRIALDVVVAVALNALVAIPTLAVVTAWLRPALPDHQRRRRRRRAYTTGGLSPVKGPDGAA